MGHTPDRQPGAEPPTETAQLRFAPVWLIRTVLLGGVLGVVILAGETAFRFLLPQDLSGFWFVTSERGTQYNKSTGTARHQFGDRITHYRFNQHHLRGEPVDFDRRRILALGDSYTFGSYLDEDKTYVARLSRICEAEYGEEKCQFLNGGTGGWGTADYLAFLEDIGPELSPEVVVVFLNSDDIRRSLVSGLYQLTDDRRNVEPARVTVQTSLTKRILNGIPAYNWLLEHSHLAQAIRRVPLQILQARAQTSSSTAVEAPAALADAIELEKQLFRRIARWCAEHQARLLVVTTGFWRLQLETINQPSGERINRAFFEQAPAFFANEGISFADISDDVFASAKGDLESFLVPGDVHPNEAGAELIARHAWDWLRPQLARLP